MCLIEPSIQLHREAFSGGEMFRTSERALFILLQSFDLAALRVTAQLLAFVWRLLKELVLPYEQCCQQVVWLHGMNTVQRMRNGRIRSHSMKANLGTRCMRARPDEVFERSPVTRSLSGVQRSGVINRNIVATSTARELKSVRGPASCWNEHPCSL
jgi:hypothetical protein